MTTEAKPWSAGELDHRRVIAIDGPAGSGKSTVARRVAEATGLAYLDTGAMYRAITLGTLNRGIEPDDDDAVARALPEIEIEIGRSTVLVDGAAATDAIRSSGVTRAVSAVASNSAVRSALRGLQRQWITQHGGGVLEGRDIGTVVAPRAAVKIYVTASTGERARRRALESGQAVAEVEADLVRRDAADTDDNRQIGWHADDATMIDTTERSIDQVVDLIVDLAAQAGVITRGAVHGSDAQPRRN